MRSTCTLLATALLLASLAPGQATADDLFAADATYLGEIDASRAPPTTTTKGSELGVDGQLAFARELSRKGLPEAALTFLRHAARQHPERADVWYQLATTLEASKREREAAVAFDRYLALSSVGQSTPDRDLHRTASRDWSPAATQVRPRPTAIVLPDPEPAPAVASRPPPRPRRAKPAGPPPTRKQVNGMLEILGEL